MLLSEDRCAAAEIVRNEHGQAEYLVYDDIGCMLDQEVEHGSDRVQSRYVRDYDRRDWIDARAAFFLRAPGDRIRTPMGSNIVAFSRRSGAQPYLDAVGGESFDGFAALHEARVTGKKGIETTPAR